MCIYIYIYMYTHMIIYIYMYYSGISGYGLSILRTRYFVPRMFVCVVFGCLAILRIEGCLNCTLYARSTY